MNLPKKGKWLVAVSTGADSMALLEMCRTENLYVEVAFVNYHVRTQAEEEQRYILAFCKEHGIICHVKDDPFVYEGNFEACARDYRYAFFEQLVKERNLDGILTAHHQDDAIETWVMQKEKGIIPAYYGIEERTYFHGIPLVRPLLEQTKKELEEYCHSHHVTYYVDHTNLEDIHVRNQIRHSLIDTMTKEERVKILAEMENANTELKVMREKATALFCTHGIVRQAYAEADEAVRLTALRRLIDPKNEMHRTTAWLKETDYVILTHADLRIEVREKLLAVYDGILYIRPKDCTYRVVRNGKEETEGLCFRVSSKGKRSEAVTLTAKDFPVTIRNARPGDRIELRFGTKKIHRFFIDRHIPQGMRDMWPVVENASGEIVLVPGLGCRRQSWSEEPTFYVQVRFPFEDGIKKQSFENS